MLQITEDTPPDMLAGAMDLTVHLPTGRAVKMAVERSTPMMDLLVQITTNHQLQLSNFTLQALGMAPSPEHSDKILPYKPNTPIGTLDTQHIKVVPKSRTLPASKGLAPGHQPFESTFRLKVHLPRNQLYVTRVSRNVLLEDIMKKVCEEKNLDSSKYEFKHPGNLDEVLDPKLTLSDYQITEIYVVAKGTASLTQAFSSNDIMALRKEEERKQMHNKTGGGVFNLIFRKGKSSMGSGSISSDTRSISPTHSDDSRSVTPPALKQKIITSPKKEPPPPERPKPPQRKRRPAPKPPGPGPQVNENRRNSEEVQSMTEESRRVSEESRVTVDSNRMKPEKSRKTSDEKPTSNISEVSEVQTRKTENGLTICHSRNSSDSSGYHEASVLSENGNTSLPRRPKSAFVAAGDLNKVSKMHSQSTTNLSKMSCHSKSTTSLGLAGRKKKAAPPPPPAIRASNPAINVVANPSPVVVASQPPVYQQESFSSQQALDSLVSITSSPSINIAEVKKEDTFFGSTDSGIAQETVEKLSETEEVHTITPPPPPYLEDLPENLDIPEPVCTFEENNQILKEVQVEILPDKVDASPPKEDFEERLIEPIIVPKEFTDPKPIEETDEIDWQYQIPSPPKAFRDTSPIFFNDTPISDCKDSVVTSPELFEKLKTLEDNQFDKETIVSDVSSVVSEEEKPLCNNLSLENLEKRKTLVYNRELTTSLKMSASESIPHRSEAVDSFSSSLSKFESTFIEIQKSSHKGTEDSKYVKKSMVHTTNTLPNFKISTYDRPKQKIKVFEDDTVRSNTENFKVHTSNFEQAQIKTAPSLTRSFLGRSMENITFKPPSSSYSRADKEYRYSRNETSTATPKSFGPISSVFRSESFSAESNWSPTRPVSRSKSQLSLNTNKHKEKESLKSDTNISRSNSLYDVSGLQSLGVMRLIQNKLSTPTSSMENINQYSKYKHTPYAKLEPKLEAISNKVTPEPQRTISTPETVHEETIATPEIVPSRNSVSTTLPDSLSTKTNTTSPSFAESLAPKDQQTDEQSKPAEKIYKYRGPPSISMSTWSERPKVPVNIKEDSDYKLSNHNVNSKLIVNTTNNHVTSNNTVEIRNNFNNNQVKDATGVSIKVNGAEALNGNQYQSDGNVVIKIGSANVNARPKTIDNQRFINHTTAVGYRKPFSSLSTNQTTPRPHSIAFDSDFDASRIPVVRSFELKKPYKDLGNTTVTQIYHRDDKVKSSTLGRSQPTSELHSRFSSMQNRYGEPEETSELAKRFATMNNRHSYASSNGQDSKETKPVFRVSSFKPAGSAPVVRGFKQNNDSNRLSWSGANTYSTLPAKSKEAVAPKMNQFSQPQLKKVDFNKKMDQELSVSNSFNSLPSTQRPDVKAPPPPMMPKAPVARKPIEPVVDQRDQLLSAIRNFGGKKGLKAVKV